MATLAVITVNVHDMDQAVVFYTEHLGFGVRDAAAAPAYVELESQGPLLLLQQCERPAKADYPDGACVLLNLAIDDVEAELGRLRAIGADVLHDKPQICPVGRYIAVADPSGNVVELIEFTR
ncbi:VOC family protein [Luedemannella helvata]|uniref:VOC family protein n=1 Tax=Luedemannella helvata TaxID=349315 RepID=A0ABN2KVK8_9ACTN